jgi:hypothetical protein
MPRVCLRWRLADNAGVLGLALDAVEPADQVDCLAGSARLALGQADRRLDEATPGCVRKGAYASCSPLPMALATRAGPCEGV